MDEMTEYLKILFHKIDNDMNKRTLFTAFRLIEEEISYH